MNHLLKRCINPYYSSATYDFTRLFGVLLVMVFPLTQSHSQCVQLCESVNTFWGHDAGMNSDGSFNSFFGASTGVENNGSFNSLFGYEAGHANQNASDNSFFGARAGRSNFIGSFNSFFGSAAGLNNFGDRNSFFGHDAGQNNTTGERNSFFGSNAGKSNTFGHRNAFFGQDAGTTNTVGSDNSFFGRDAGRFNENGFNNSFFGHDAGRFNTSGQFNSFFGEASGKRITTGSRVICLGYESGPSTANSDVLDRLYIDVEESDDPLIYGEFDNDFIRINGTFEAMGVGNNSDINRKELIIPIDYNDILDKITDLPISEWSYKGDEIRHIGPMAQDFYSTFGVGKNETTITTIDADGVALAGIKALRELNVNQQSEIDALKQELAELKSMLTSLTKTATKD